MEEKNIIEMLNELCGESKKIAALIVTRNGKELTVAATGYGAVLGSTLIKGRMTRPVCNAMINLLAQLIISEPEK